MSPVAIYNFGPLNAYTGVSRAEVPATLNYLRTCIKARNAGYPVSYTNDPKWLINMAINRRACWPDDPSGSRGSAMPVNGRYPKRAEGRAYWRVWRMAFAVNSRICVYSNEARILHTRHAKRLAWRFTERFKD